MFLGEGDKEKFGMKWIKNIIDKALERILIIDKNSAGISE